MHILGLTSDTLFIWGDERDRNGSKSGGAIRCKSLPPRTVPTSSSLPPHLQHASTTNLAALMEVLQPAAQAVPLPIKQWSISHGLALNNSCQTFKLLESALHCQNTRALAVSDGTLLNPMKLTSGCGRASFQQNLISEWASDIMANGKWMMIHKEDWQKYTWLNRGVQVYSVPGYTRVLIGYLAINSTVIISITSLRIIVSFQNSPGLMH